MGLIIHIAHPEHWQTAQTQGEYRPEGLEVEGFIHCSTVEQVIQVANAFYRGQHGLVLLVIDMERVRSPIKVEPPIHPNPEQADSVAEEQYPHIYGSLNLDAIVQVVDFSPNANGTFTLPAALKSV
ncbi:DUF952 domain-containing protein [Oculatella sp. LEGE 06141]|nr:DUF952 domain-containing protein [Oculatella sp. LEGE 06141]